MDNPFEEIRQAFEKVRIEERKRIGRWLEKDDLGMMMVHGCDYYSMTEFIEALLRGEEVK